MPDLYMDVDVNLAEVPVNILPLLDDTDFKSRETGITYDQAGMDLVWNFVTTAGAFTQTAVVPTTAGNYDWTNQGDGMYTIEIIATGGVSINNDTEGFGWFTGVATGVLPWRGPTIGFRRAALNDLLTDGSTASTNMEDFFDGTGYVGGTAKLTVDAVAISGDATAADNAELMFDGTGYAGGTTKLGVNLVQILGTAITEAAGLIAAAFSKFFNKATPTGTVNSLPDAVAGAAGGVAIVGSEMGLANGSITAAKIADGAIDNATFAADVGSTAYATNIIALAADKAIVNAALGTAAELAKVPKSDAAVTWNATALASIQTEANDALVANNLDHLVGTATGIPAIPAGTFIDQVMDDGTAVYDRTTDSLQAIRDTAPLGTAMRGTDNAALASVVTETRLAELDAANLPTDVSLLATAAAVAALNNLSSAQAQSAATAALNAYDPPTRTELTTDKDSIITEVNANETKIDTIDGIVDAILLDTGTDGVPLTAAAVDAIHDEVVEGTITMRQFLRLILASTAGVTGGSGTATVTFKGVDDTTTRITATVGSGNRTAITRNVS